MHMPTLTRRLQVLLDEERYQRLRTLAERQDRTVAELVRDALDRAYPGSDLSIADAGRRFLERPPLDDLGDQAAVKREIEGLHDPRG